MAWSDPGDFTSGQILTAAQMDSVREAMFFGQATFTNEAARDAAIPATGIALQEGMRAYLTAPTVPAATGATSTQIPTGITTIYNGSVWVCVSELGARSAGASANFTTGFTDTTVGGTATSVTLVTGTTALVSFFARINGNGNFANISVKTGTLAASADWAAFNQASAYVTVGRTFVMSGLTAGTNTFTVQGQNNVAGANCDQITLAVRGIA
jgi:hypothetical protein